VLDSSDEPVESFVRLALRFLRLGEDRALIADAHSLPEYRDLSAAAKGRSPRRARGM
jgi:hypothetical protein